MRIYVNGTLTPPAGGFANPMTAIGDLIAGKAGGAPDRLAAGSAGYIMRVVSGQPAWREISAAGLAAARPDAAAAREGQTYWSTDAAAGAQLSICVHKGGATYAWELLAYGAPGLPVATGAGEVPVSTGAGATYAASPFSDEVGTVLAAFLGGTAGQTVIGDGAGDVGTTSAPVSALLAASTTAGMLSALGLASVPPVALGAAYNAGSSATAYLDVAGTPPAAPLGGPGETLVYLFLPVGMPSDARIMVQHMDSGSVARGWEIRYGDNGGDRGLLSMLLYGMNGSGVFELPGASFNGALNVPHVLAITITGAGVPRYSWDGGAVAVLPALSGTYVPPISGDPFTIGSRSGGNYPADKAQIVQFRAYSTVLSDADLVAVAATRTSFRLADPSAGTLTTDISASNASGFGSVLDRANSSRRWRVNGELKAQEQP